MSALSVVRAGAIGILELTVSTAALGVTVRYVPWMSLEPAVGLLCAALAFVGGLAWACVRIAHLQPTLAMILAAAPFGFPMVATAWLLDRFILALFLSSVVLLLLTLLVTWVATRIAAGAIGLSKRRVCYIVAIVVGITLVWGLTIRLASIPIHSFDHSWNVEHGIPIDRIVTRMAARAQFDAYVFGVPFIGRGKLHLEGASKHGSDYDLGFNPTWASDTLVLYRFRADGKPLWKTCNWVNWEPVWRKALERSDPDMVENLEHVLYSRSAYEQGQRDAQADIRSGLLVLEDYGLPRKGQQEFAEILRQRYGVELRRVASDIVYGTDLGHAFGYNDVSRPEIERRFGDSVIQKAAAEAEQHYRGQHSQ